jgi:hypothetical protein
MGAFLVSYTNLARVISLYTSTPTYVGPDLEIESRCTLVVVPCPADAVDAGVIGLSPAVYWGYHFIGCLVELLSPHQVV